MIKPIMSWESQDATDSEGKVVWWSRLDGRYQVEVHRIDAHKAILYIFDHNDSDKMIYARDTGLSYGAMFAPDVFDIETWSEIACNFVDNLGEQNA